MTIDDEKSVYVGGLPYDTTEDTLRKAFDLYGRVVVVKIVNDRGVGGKCYGFVTFTNPGAATNAINDMNGRKIDGRVVKVSEVKTRGGRSNFGHENFKRNPERGTDWDRGRDRDRIDDRDRSRDRRRERSLDRSLDRERGYNRIRDLHRTRDQLPHRDRGRDHHVDNKDMEQEHDRNYDRPRDRDSNSDRYQDTEGEQSKDQHRSEEKGRGQNSRLFNGSGANDHQSREISSEFIGDDNQYQVEEQMGFSAQRLEELKKEVSQMEGLIKEKKEFVAKLQEKSQSLEVALSNAKRRTSQCQMQQTKLLKSYLHTKEYSDKLKSTEEELQSLVDSIMIEIDYADNAVSRKGVLANGNSSHLQCV